MIKFISYLLVLSLTTPSQALCQSHEKDQPNVILILADDLGYGDLSCYGSESISTPNIDRLAKEGVKFTSFYANGAECTPTRAALLTGRYQHRVGGLECAIGLNGVGRYADAIRLDKTHDLGLPANYSAIPSMLNKVGYNTALIGKWHLGYEPKFQPKAHGFNFSLGPIGGEVDYFEHSIPIGMFLGKMINGEHDFYRNGIEQHREGYYLTDLITDESVSWINNQKKNKPFFLFVPYTAVHKPYQGPDDYIGRKLTVEEQDAKSKEKYKAMLEEMDKGIGKILEKVKEEGIEDNTVIIFTSDNGPAGTGSAGQFSGGKGRLLEGGIRVPCIIKWPGHIKPGTVSDQVGITMDLTASIARIAHTTAPIGRPFDGEDIIKYIETDRPVHPRILFWRKQRGERIARAVRSGDMKYLYAKQSDTTMKHHDKIKEGLYNLKKDPQEKNNLITKEPKELKRLKELLKYWELEVKPER